MQSLLAWKDSHKTGSSAGSVAGASKDVRSAKKTKPADTEVVPSVKSQST